MSAPAMPGTWPTRTDAGKRGATASYSTSRDTVLGKCHARAFLITQLEIKSRELASAELVRVRKQRREVPVSASRARDSKLLHTRRPVIYLISLPYILRWGGGATLRFRSFCSFDQAHVWFACHDESYNTQWDR